MKKTLLGILKVAISVSLLVYLISIVDVENMLDRFKDIDQPWIGIALVLLIVQVAISALKWKLILESDGAAIRYGLLLKSYYIGNFLSLFLPSSFGGDIYRVYSVTTVNTKLGKSVSSVLFDRLTGLFALLSISFFSYLAFGNGAYVEVFVLGYLAGLIAFILSTSAPVEAFLRRYSNRICVAAASLTRSFRAYRTDPGKLACVLAIAFVFQFMIVVINKLYATALSISIQFTELMIIVPLVYLTEAIPVSINGIGVRDSAFVLLFVAIGHTKEEGLAMGLLVVVMRYVSGLIGGAVLTGSVIHQQLRSRQPKT